MSRQKIFKKFIKENLNNAYGYAFTIVKNKQDAEDIVHDSVVKGLKHIDSLKDMSKIKPWFYRIISNSAFTMINREKRITLVENNVIDEETALEIDSEGVELFNDMISSLDPKYRAVVVLRFFEDMTIKEVASTLKINENTAKTRLYRAIESLKADMEDCNERAI